MTEKEKKKIAHKTKYDELIDSTSPTKEMEKKKCICIYRAYTIGWAGKKENGCVGFGVTTVIINNLPFKINKSAHLSAT